MKQTALKLGLSLAILILSLPLVRYISGWFSLGVFAGFLFAILYCSDLVQQLCIEGVFRRLKLPQVTDPLFGQLKRNRFGWEGGTIASPALPTKILVSVERTGEPPNEADRAAMTALLRNYPELIPGLKDALFRLWEPGLEGESLQEKQPTSADSLWATLELGSAEVCCTGAVDLLYSFKDDVRDIWPDAVFRVRVLGMNVVPLSLDD